MWRCVWRCLRSKLGWWAVLGLAAFITALLATGGNVVLAAAIAGVTLSTFAFGSSCELLQKM